jgi:hypothetical protein
MFAAWTPVTGDPVPGPTLRQFHQIFPDARAIQVVLELDRERTYPDGIAVLNAASFLKQLDLA